MLELSRPKCKILRGCQSEMSGTDAEAVVDLFSWNKHLWRSSAKQTIEETTLGTDYSNLLGANSSKKKTKAKALLMLEQTTSGVETLLPIDAYRKYEALRMFNLLQVLVVRLLAKGIVQQFLQIYEFQL